MPKFFINNNQINNNSIKIAGGDVNHIINVLRMKNGDKLQICNLDSGETYLSEIVSYNKDEVNCEIKENMEINNETNINITLFQGLPKFDKMEFIIQKNTEIGVKAIVPVSMKRSIAKLANNNNKIDRWKRIAEIASKQSMRNFVPLVENVITIDELCNRLKNFDIVLLAYECEQNKTLKSELIKLKKNFNYNIAIIIGPEGGIDSKEIDKIIDEGNVKVVTLGRRILRTETAGMVMASNIIYELEE